jgi:UDP-N-acetylmuramyl pentapeptide phosphotransferase/UDP-N-acetylglucosamine-1-phosphate transferase
MELLVTLLVYLIVFAIIYYIVLAILGFLDATPAVVKLAKLIMALIAFLFVIALFFGAPYQIPRIHWK